jgi:myo-inositol-1(or 4)-monophosphatase
LDGYWAAATHPWDVAAGVLLVREAGGVVTDLGGGDLDLMQARLIAASGPPLAEQIRDLVSTDS